MPLPNLISCNIIVCQKLLREADGVTSAIRIVDLFFYTPNLEIPIEHQQIRMSVFVGAKLWVGPDEIEHTATLHLHRPDGERITIGNPLVGTFASKFPNVPGGFQFCVEIVVIPKLLGTHYFTIEVDGQEIGREAFTLQEQIENKTTEEK